MRLSSSIREAITASVIASIPQENYRTKMQDRAQLVAAAVLPRLIKTAWDDPKLRGFIRAANIYTCCRYMTVPAAPEDSENMRALIEKDEQWKALHAQHDAQTRALRSATRAVQAALASVSTTDKFAELYPDLAKHMPVKDTVTPSVPARTDVMEKLRAAGLPVEV